MKTKRFNLLNLFSNIVFILFSLCCILPLILILSISFSSESVVLDSGFSLLPTEFSLSAYKAVFNQASSIVSAYCVTSLYAVCGSLLSVIIMAMGGYVLAHPKYKFKKIMTVMLAITMFFNGGLIPSYLVNTQLLHLGDKIWIYLVVNLVSAYTVFVFSSFFSQLPQSLRESAALDGASEMQILGSIVVPMSMPVLATFGFMEFIGRWNNYETSMYYITDPKLYTLQYLLQNVLNEAETIKQMQQKLGIDVGNLLPTETMKFAICVISTIPILLVFPFFQKYYTKGMLVGSIKE